MCFAHFPFLACGVWATACGVVHFDLADASKGQCRFFLFVCFGGEGRARARERCCNHGEASSCFACCVRLQC